MILDDRSSDSLFANRGACWQAITDTVMGGVSDGRLKPALIEGRPCLRLTGEISLLNNGGFVQASLDLDTAGLLDARGYTGIEIEVFGNGETYNLHLRSADTRIVWQSYRVSFQAPPCWQTLRVQFTSFQPYRIDMPLDLSKLRRLGVVAIGREMRADVCIARLSLYT
ncbi:CIA30 family protein [Gammaproteobacteria bacterium]